MGIRLLGIPKGSSPISPEGWAPAGLKYLSKVIDQLEFEFAKSIIILSTVSFVVPYGFVQLPVLCFSSRGRYSGTPYTVADELNTNLNTLNSSITVRRLQAPCILLL